ncbi:MAG: hypothetical protein KIT18_14670 [Burkholderiales bacterium]|nr:hypothetical protein [Burkholderiales bacterium]
MSDLLRSALIDPPGKAATEPIAEIERFGLLEGSRLPDDTRACYAPFIKRLILKVFAMLALNITY